MGAAMILKPCHQSRDRVFATYLRVIKWRFPHLRWAQALHDAAADIARREIADEYYRALIPTIKTALEAHEFGHMSAADALAAIKKAVSGTDIQTGDL